MPQTFAGFMFFAGTLLLCFAVLGTALKVVAIELRNPTVGHRLFLGLLGIVFMTTSSVMYFRAYSATSLGDNTSRREPVRPTSYKIPADMHMLPLKSPPPTGSSNSPSTEAGPFLPAPSSSAQLEFPRQHQQ